MPVGSTLELYTTILGWFLYDAIWGILINSGIAIIPFVATAIAVLIDTRDGQWEITSDGLVRILETRLYTMLFVVALAVQPQISVHPSNTTYTQYRCQVTSSGSLVKTTRELAFGASESAHDRSGDQYMAMLDGRIPQAPLWWYLMTKLNHAITQSARQELPCSADLRTMAAGLQDLGVKDTLLRDELKDFTKQCWQPAINQYARERLAETEIHTRFRGGKIREDIAWPGSDFFHTRLGYYDTLRATKSVDAFTYTSTRDSVIAPPGINDGLGYPTCHEWWSGYPASGGSFGANRGLRVRLIDDLKKGAEIDGDDACDDCAGAWWKFWSSDKYFTDTERDDALIKTALNNGRNDVAMEMTNGNQEIGGAAGGVVDRIARNAKQRVGTLGLMWGGIKKSTETEVVRQTAPIIQSCILLVFTVTLPVLLLVGSYSLSNLVALSLLQFSIIFWSFLFSLAAWVDNFLLTGLLGSADTDSSTLLNAIGGPAGALDSVTPLLVISWVSWALYTIVPVAFTYFLGVVGVRAGAQVSEAIGRGASGVGAQGAKGVDVVQKGITKGRG